MNNLIIILLFVLLVLALFLSIQLESLSLMIIITIVLLILYIVFERKNSLLQKKSTTKNYTTYYFKKQFMTDCEYEFYKKIKVLEDHFKIVPQVNLGAIINKVSKITYRGELFRNIDFAIFTKDYSKLLLLIELNDKSHNQEERKDRDQKVKKICKDAGIKLIFFYTSYSNDKEYVINRILSEIEKQYKN